MMRFFSVAGMREWQHWLCGIALLWLVLCAHAPAAQGATLHIGHGSSYVLSPYFEYLEDTSGSLQMEQVLEARAAGKFKPAPQGAAATNFGSTRSVIWLHAAVQTDADAPGLWMLEVANPPLDRMDLYVSRGTRFDHQSGGDSLPFAQRVVPHRNHVKPIDLQPGGTSELYLRVQSNGTMSAPATLWQPAALWQHDQRNYSVFSLYFGLLIGLLLYNLLLFFSVRDSAYGNRGTTTCGRAASP